MYICHKPILSYSSVGCGMDVEVGQWNLTSTPTFCSYSYVEVAISLHGEGLFHSQRLIHCHVKLIMFTAIIVRCDNN